MPRRECEFCDFHTWCTLGVINHLIAQHDFTERLLLIRRWVHRVTSHLQKTFPHVCEKCDYRFLTCEALEEHKSAQPHDEPQPSEKNVPEDDGMLEVDIFTGELREELPWRERCDAETNASDNARASVELIEAERVDYLAARRQRETAWFRPRTGRMPPPPHYDERREDIYWYFEDATHTEQLELAEAAQRVKEAERVAHSEDDEPIAKRTRRHSKLQ